MNKKTKKQKQHRSTSSLDLASYRSRSRFLKRYGNDDGMIVLDVLSYFILIELPTVAFAEGEACGPADSKPCVKKKTTYLDALNMCILPHYNHGEVWRYAIDDCHREGGYMVEPNTMERSKVFAQYAKRHNIHIYWIGLSLELFYVRDFIWSQNRNVLTKVMHERFGEERDRGTCVLSRNRGKITWVLDDCLRLHYFFCGITSAFMPKKPVISTDYNSWSLPITQVGSELHVSCEAMLSKKGSLKLVLFNEKQRTFYGFNSTRVVYNESLVTDEDGLCKRYGVISLTLWVTPDLDGKTLACVSFLDEAYEMCSQPDRHCDVAGTINASTESPEWDDPGGPSDEVLFPWWIIVVLVVIIFSFMMLLPKVVERLHGEDAHKDIEGSRSGSFQSGEPSDESRQGP